VPRVTIPVTRLSDAGNADPTETDGDPVNQHALPNTGRTVLRVRNAGATALDLTLVTPVTVGGRAVEDTTVSIPAGATRTFGSLSTGLYGTSVPIDVESTDLKLLAFEP
jgi:mRNA-degrading endonuclease toxin of MazEF toxin-antitoxin module